MPFSKSTSAQSDPSKNKPEDKSKDAPATNKPHSQSGKKPAEAAPLRKS